MKAIKNYRVGFVLLTVFAAVFVFGSSSAEAKVKVEGSREFRDDVNGCLNTYRGASGIVGDVIKELEKSKKEHKIINDPAWSNTPNDGAAANGGAGTGTVTRVDKAELETYKQKFDELKNKDFCTAILHELWHAVDADRGAWTNDEVGGVNRDEIEATTFQNFIHALRGADPRTSYGGVDISKEVLTPEERTAPASPPAGGSAPVPSAAPQGAQPEVKATISTSFNHVKPGEYSEIYATIKTKPGAQVDVKLTGPGVSGKPEQNDVAGADGTLKFTWKIVSYGTYTVEGTAGSDKINSTVNVR